MTRAVMYAGTPAVVASLWEVGSKATKELMIKFYKNMLEKEMDKTEALRQAKLELLKSEKYSSPYFWSAFVPSAISCISFFASPSAAIAMDEVGTSIPHALPSSTLDGT